jgi:hypothetical protein
MKSLSLLTASPLLLLLAIPAAAAAPVTVYPAQITGANGIDTGKVLLVGNNLVFVDDQNPANSFDISRSDISGLGMANGAMNITLGQPFNSPLVMGQSVVLRFTGPYGPAEVTSWAGIPPSGSAVTGEANRGPVPPPSGAAPPVTMYEFNVHHDDDNGRLVIGAYDVHFESFNHPDHSRTWAYSDIKSFTRDQDDRQVKIQPYHGDSYTFKIQGGQAMTDQVYNLIGDRLVAARVQH